MHDHTTGKLSSGSSLLIRATSATGLVIISTIFGVAVWLLMDLLILSPFFIDPTVHIFKHGDYGWYTLKPNLKHAVGKWGRSVYAVSTDANGFRIDDGQDGLAGPAQFVFLGDSFTFGVNGPWSETFVGMFARSSGAGVVNTGVSGYSPTVYVHRYRQALAAKALRPGHVAIVALDISDVADEASKWEDGREHPQQRNWSLQKQAWVPFQTFVGPRFLASWRIYRFIRYNLIDAMLAPHVFERLRSAFTWRDWAEIESSEPLTWADEDERLGYRPLGVAGGLAKVREKMRILANIVKQNGGELWIVIYPWPAQLKYGEAIFDWEKFGHDLCAEIGCRGLINTFPEFRAAASAHSDWYSRYYVSGDFHLNELGNQIIAEALINNFRNRAEAKLDPAPKF